MVEGGECRVVGGRQGVDVPASRDDGAVSEALVDDLEVGAGGEQPEGVGVA